MSARYLVALMAALAARGLIAPGIAAGRQRLVEARRVAADTLRDVAVTGIEDGRATIYYNPALLERLGPQFGDFIMAHEEGHVFFGHAGGALLTSQPDFAQARQQQELEADGSPVGRISSAELAESLTLRLLRSGDPSVRRPAAPAEPR